MSQSAKTHTASASSGPGALPAFALRNVPADIARTLRYFGLEPADTFAAIVYGETPSETNTWRTTYRHISVLMVDKSKERGWCMTRDDGATFCENLPYNDRLLEEAPETQWGITFAPELTSGWHWRDTNLQCLEFGRGFHFAMRREHGTGDAPELARFHDAISALQFEGTGLATQESGTVATRAPSTNTKFPPQFEHVVDLEDPQPASSASSSKDAGSVKESPMEEWMRFEKEYRDIFKKLPDGQAEANEALWKVLRKMQFGHMISSGCGVGGI